jgi:hypothetical protein
LGIPRKVITDWKNGSKVQSNLVPPLRKNRDAS